MAHLPGKTVRSSTAPQLVQVHASTLPPSSPNSPAIGFVPVRRSAGCPQAGHGWPGVGGGDASRASRSATRFSSASSRSGADRSAFHHGT